LALQLDIVAETGSTNADLLARLADGEAIAEGYWLIADRQTQGRGRHGRKWLDAPGNFMGSTVVHLDPGGPPPATLSFAAALALYETAAGLLPDPSKLQLKWPNDVLLKRAKFSGILLECEGTHAVIGMGVNLASAPNLADRATGCLSESGVLSDRDLFARELAMHFEAELRRWRNLGTESLLRRWQAAAHRPGTSLTVHDEKGHSLRGTYEGLAPDGALLLRLADGSTRVIHAGDVMLEAR
jgi:BirA family biotin operon repressor/biotin-[acetyl-CoA-carboxylase] ligase